MGIKLFHSNICLKRASSPSCTQPRTISSTGGKNRALFSFVLEEAHSDTDREERNNNRMHCRIH
jgi:hypothetical protein